MSFPERIFFNMNLFQSTTDGYWDTDGDIDDCNAYIQEYDNYLFHSYRTFNGERIAQYKLLEAPFYSSELVEFGEDELKSLELRGILEKI